MFCARTASEAAFCGDLGERVASEAVVCRARRSEGCEVVGDSGLLVSGMGDSGVVLCDASDCES